MAEALHRRLGMTDEELAAVVAELGRAPNHLELAMYSVMWSEHCSYKSSRAFLSRFPTEAPWVLVGPGEGAGVVDIGDGLAVAVRIESHNHPSAVEPYQGAATGVGGIIRDIFSMGARPIALMDPLRFGPLDDARTRYLFEGVVSGISGYGNAVGVPTVGGEVVFDDCYRDNPLVNVLCLGLLPHDRLVLVQPDDLAEVLGLCERWEIDASVVGRVTESRRFRVYDGVFDGHEGGDGDAEPLADVPVESLGDGPLYDRPRARPAGQDALQAADPAPELAARFPAGADLSSELLAL